MSFFTHFTIVLPRLNAIFCPTFTLFKNVSELRNTLGVCPVLDFILVPFCFGTDPLVPFWSLVDSPL